MNLKYFFEYSFKVLMAILIIYLFYPTSNNHAIHVTEREKHVLFIFGILYLITSLIDSIGKHCVTCNEEQKNDVDLVDTLDYINYI